MFRIESYITSIILSYVDRYIKNFRHQDAQVSLWEGDGSFQNLNLDLEVLEQELNLPLSFVSGHIHELLIHVPWTRLASEPVEVTINTIECVMKLKPPGSTPTVSQGEMKSKRLKPEEVPPSSYISSLVNKIICNLSITCNNLILKYVEEDIVLSMNIKTLTLNTVNADWISEFSDLSPSQLILRKLISLSDVTICLDKRNASGRIESYLEPLLYRCNMSVRLSRTYPSANALRAIATHIDIFCEQMAFTLSEPQVPMIMRLIALALALNRKQFTSQTSIATSVDATTSSSDTESSDLSETAESWSSWVMSWVPSIYPLVGEDNDDLNSGNTIFQKSTFHFGFYVDTFLLALKLCEQELPTGKCLPNTYLHISLHGCLCDITLLNSTWTNVKMGISEASIQPAGDCCCGTSESNTSQQPYLSCGKIQDSFLDGSLFSSIQNHHDPETICNWDYHLSTLTETILLEKTPAFAIDYMFSSVIPKIYDTEDEEIEKLPPKERVLIRYVAGPMVIRVTSGLIHRIQMIMKAAANYDYNPYGSATQVPTIDKNVLHLSEHLSEGGFDWNEELISCYFPSHVSQFTAFGTKIEFYPANHMPVLQSSLGRKLSRPQKRAQNSMPAPSTPPPCVLFEWMCVYASLTRPYNPDKWLQMANCFESGKLPNEIIATAQTRLAFRVVGVSSSLNISHNQPMKLVEMSSITCDQTCHYLLQRLDREINSDTKAKIGRVTITSSRPKLLLLTNIIHSLVATNNKLKYQRCFNTIYHSSLIKDATKTTETIYLKISVEDINVRRVLTGISETVHFSNGAIQAFMIRLPEKGPEIETMILNAPDVDQTPNPPFLSVIFQYPKENSVYPPVLSFKSRELRLSIDPLLYDWLLYTPISMPTPLPNPKIIKSWKSVDSIKMRKVSESSLSSHPKRAVTPQESVHSSSEKETIPSAHPSSLPIFEAVQPVPVLPISERISSWFPVWKSLVITGDISQWSVYLPNYSLAESTPKSMESSLQDGIKYISRMLQVVVIKLPSTTLQCNSNKENPLDVVGRSIPIALPPSIWSPDKTNFPWILNIKDMQSYTLHGNKRLQLLKPVTVNCTITTSPKFSDDILTSLALCVHLQTFPVIISLSEDQVELLAGLMMIQSRVYNTLSTSWSTETVPCEEPVVNVKLISSDESLSTSQPAEESVEGDIQNGVKLTAWFQWLIAKFTLKIYSSPAQNSNADLKLALDVEDIILSLDVEKVYHKIKLKVATASISHFTRKSLENPWSLGAFKGFVMRGYDPDGVNVSSAKKHTPDDATISSGFLTATLTRARCSNLHSKIGSPTKSKSISKKYSSNIEVENSFITEIVVKLQPLDFVLSPAILGTFFHVLDPLVSVTGPGCSSSTNPSSSLPLKFSTSSLPLLYLDLMTIRVMFPTSNMEEKNQHDVLIFQLDKLVVNPQPENPICRNPIRQDIYHAAEKRRILNIPGSEVEDRQYQIDFLSIKVSTGMWYELENLLIQEPTDTIVQNPALDWNEGRSPNAPEPNLLASIISPFNLSLVLAPAILFKNSILVCGHSAEVNGVSEINTKLSLDQLHLCSVLAAETRTVLHTVPKNKQHNFISVQKMHQFENESVGSIIHNLEFDSGIESVGSSIHTISKRVDQNMAAVHSLTTTGIQIHSPLPSTISHQPYSPLPKPNIVVPIELFVTGSGFNFVLFKKHQLNEELGVEPLLYVQISQPHLYARRFGETTTCQISIFDLSLRTGKMNNFISNDDISVKCFPLSIVKTRSGDPNPLTGIPPALLTARLTKTNNKSPQLHLDMGRPLRVSISIEILEYFQRMRILISNSLMVENKGEEMDKSIQSKIEKLEDLLENEVDMNLQKYLTYFTTITANTQQLVLALLSRNEANGGLTISLNQLTAELSHQQTVSGSATVHNLSIATQSLPGHCPQLLINPWTFCIHTLLSWESWIPVNFSPVMNLMVDSEVLRLDFSPDQLWRLQELVTEYDNFYKKQHKKDIDENQNTYEDNVISPSCEEQHYHDDLQTGAFQFIDATKAFEGLPQTYQVVFSNGEGSSTTSPTMSWKYPQPRALTKLHIQPIPFTDSITVPSVKCVLQFYNNNQNTYMDYVEFSLSESEVCVVDLPTDLPELVANTTWRVVLGISNFDIPPIPVRALAGSLRVNSYFSPKLVPTIQLDFNFQSIQLSLWSQVSTIRPLPESLSRYFLDGCLPPDQDFLTASMDQTNFCFTLWPNKSRLFTTKSRPRLDVVSYVTLSKQCCVPPFPLMARVFSNPKDINKCSLVIGSVFVRLGPAICHTLAASSALWMQFTSNKPRHQVVLPPYVICNNSCLPIRIGQANTDEVIPLQCLQCHLYSWRTVKTKLLLRFSLLNSDDWSQGFSLQKEGSQVVKVKDKANRECTLIITLKKISPAVFQVVVGGQLVLKNGISSPLELRIIPDDPEYRQTSLVLDAYSTPPSIILESQVTFSLRIRFNAFSALWSGLIPLKYGGSKTKQWQVKVPLKEKGQFRSVWCRIVWNQAEDIQRLLVVISPMYTLCSLLPCEASVFIETPELKSTKSVMVSGRGVFQDLDCPGTNESIHNLTFQLDGRAPASRPHVPLSYPMIEGNTPPLKPLNLDMDSLLDELYNKVDGSIWPFLEPEWSSVRWMQSTQPDTVTHVKVKFIDECAKGSSLLVELQPWALLVNTLGCHVYLQACERIICSVPNLAIISPPLLESTFQVGVDINASFHLSSALQLSRDQGFYMPKISGLIPPTGYINTCIDCETSLCYTNVSSSEVKGIRLIHIKSSFVISNVSNDDLKVTPLAVRKSSGDVRRHSINTSVIKSSLLLKSQRPTSKLKSQPITEWHSIGVHGDEIIPYIVVSKNNIHSCPIKIPEGPDKQSLPVIFPASTSEQHMPLLLTSQAKDGQTYLILWDQLYPQITIHNKTKQTVVFSKAQSEQGKEAMYDSEDWSWRLHIPSECSAYYQLPPLGPPELGPPYLLPPVVIAVDRFYPAPNKELKWSEAINLSTNNERRITMSGLPEISLSVYKKGFTTHILLVEGKYKEIRAVDIRGQLSRDSEDSSNMIESTQNKALLHLSSNNLNDNNAFKVRDNNLNTNRCEYKSANFSLVCYIACFTTTLLAQSENGCDCREVAALTLDNIGITVQPQQIEDVEELNIHVTTSDVQLDNQEYHAGGYDFPVVLMKQISSEATNITNINIRQNATHLVEWSRQNNPLVDVKVIIDMNSHKSPAVQDVSLQLKPLQLYVEDTFAIRLKKCLNDIIPEYFLSEVDPTSHPFSLHSQQEQIPTVIADMDGENNSHLVEAQQEKPRSKTTSTKPDGEKTNTEDYDEELFNVSEPDAEGQNIDEVVKEKLESDEIPSVTEISSENINNTILESNMLWSVSHCHVEEPETNQMILGVGTIPVPADILASLQEIARPLRLRSLSISELKLLVSVHTSTRFYIALDHSPLHLSAFQRSSLVTTAYRLGHALTLHYFLGAIYGTGWAIGSLEMLGAPGGLARTLGSGLRDFVSLPYRGILLGPRAFLVGIAHGSASLMKHITAGTVTSVTKLAASWARTLDRLTLDNEGLQHSEELRRLRPNGLTQGFVQGLTEFGISLLGAVGSIVHHPLQYMMSDDPERSLVNSIGLGLVGMITRPLSGAAELVALTGEGLLSGVGWSNNPKIRHTPVIDHNQCGTDSGLKYLWKLLPPSEPLHLVTEATTDSYEPVTLIITNNSLYVVNSDLDIVIRALKLIEVKAFSDEQDPTLVTFHITSSQIEAEALFHSRVADFVRESQRVLVGEQAQINQFTGREMSESSNPHLHFFINPQARNHFVSVLSFVTRHANGRGFPIIK